MKIEEECLLFMPRNIEKAMGAVDVEIPFSQVKLVEVTGAITESLMVRTQEKAHRFVGSNLQKINELINQVLSQYKPRNPAPESLAPASVLQAGAKGDMAARVQVAADRTGSSAQCPSCFKVLKPDHNFCPACGMAIKKICAVCRRGLELHWKFCASCGATA